MEAMNPETARAKMIALMMVKAGYSYDQAERELMRAEFFLSWNEAKDRELRTRLATEGTEK